jgi:hypothetical protein
VFLIPCTSPLDITSRILTLIFLYDIYNIIRISKLHISVDLLVYRENNKYLVSVFFPGKCQSHGWMLLELGHCDPYIYTSMVKGWMLLELDHCDRYIYTSMVKGWMLLELDHCDPYIYTSMVKGWMLLELDHCDPYLYDIREVC